VCARHGTERAGCKSPCQAIATPKARQTEIPKVGGGPRKLGLPTVLDRCIAHALLQVLQEEGDFTFSASRYGCRPQRSAHQAVGRAQADIQEGYTWVVEERFGKIL
jgi:RNA-directed DNA polymerase